MADTRSTCPYCGVGCGVIIQSDGAQITGVRGDPEHPANFGRLCSKGSTLHLTASAAITRQARLLTPQHRPQRGGPAQAVGWNEALDRVAGQLADTIARHGADAVAVYASGQLLTEDYYVFNKLVKGLLGTNQMDTNSRLCMSSAVAGYKLTLGADAPPACYDDLNHAHTVFVAGANPAWAHPVLFRRLEDARQANPAQKLLVADPRRTDTAAMADLHLALLPGSDVALFHGLLNAILAGGWADAGFIAAHTSGFDALAQRVAGFTLAETARLTGLAKADIAQAARWFADSPATLSLYCQGLNQSSSGTAKNAALINLHLATGQIGRRGAGPFSLTGQPNAMGGREVGGLANLLSAHRDLANPAHRAEVAALWGVPDVPAKPGRSAVEMFEAAADGEVKALWIACTNPAQSLPDQATVRRAFERAELVVVQEAFAHTATARLADWLLPATTWGEKDGTVTNSERRISRVRPALPPAGQARHDWQIATDIARRLEARLRPGSPSLFPYTTPESIWLEHRASTRGRDLDITGLSYGLLDTQGPQQWPWPEGAASGQARLYEDGRFATADGRARFFDTPFEPLAEPCDAEYSHSLTTGRLRDQWHGMSRTGTLGRLFGHQSEPTLDLNPHDLPGLGLAPGDLAEVRSRRGRITLPVAAHEGVAPGQAHIAMHWGSDMLGGQGADGQPSLGVNALTNGARCPRSLQPELKHAAVHISRAALPWTLVAAAWLAPEQALALRTALADWLPRFGHASVVPFGQDRHGVLLRAACTQPLPAEALDALAELFTLQAGLPQVMRYDDPARGHRRLVAVALPETAPGLLAPPDRGGAPPGAAAHPQPQAKLRAFLLAGDTRSEAWLRPLLQGGQPTQADARLLLQPGPQAPLPMAARSRQVCNCLNVDEAAIGQCLARCSGPAAERLGQLQASLRCGTQCGSCVPELRRLVQLHAAPVAAQAVDQAAPALSA